jgi:type I restriction enzyme, S subunit
MADSRLGSQTRGRPATTGVIPGNFALSVGRPDKPAPSGWKWTALSDVARLESGHTPSRSHPEYWGGDVPWVGIRDATANYGRVIADTFQHTNELGIANSSARILPTHTVCLSRTASVGHVVVMGRPMATSQDFVNWVCSDAIDWRFLKYVLLAERSAFLRFASGTTHQTIYFPEVKAFHVCLPPLQEQRAIARILGALEEKLELVWRGRSSSRGSRASTPSAAELAT